MSMADRDGWIRLDGIARRAVLELVGEMGLSVVSRRVTRDELYCADEVFFRGTAAEITPVVANTARMYEAGFSPFCRSTFCDII